MSKTTVHFTSIKDNSKDSDTYIWDLETHPYMNSKNERINRPYACACINLKKFVNIIKGDRNSSNDLSKEKLNIITKSFCVFVNKDCIEKCLNSLEN